MSSSKGKYKTLAKDTILFAISTFGSKILVFFLTPLYTSVLATEEYGAVDLITSMVNLVYPILTLAIAEATLRFSLDKLNNKNKVFVNSIWFVFLSTLFLIILTPFSKILFSSVSNYWIAFIGIYFLFNIHLVFSNFIKGLGKTRLFATQGLIQTVSIIICNILFLAIFKFGILGYLISIYIGYIIPIILIAIFGKLNKYFLPIYPDFDLLKKMLHYCVPMIPTLIAWAINTNIDKIMIISFKGLSESGIYSVAHKIPALMIAILSVFAQAWQLSAINNYGDSDESEYYTKVYNALDLVTVLGCFIIIFFTKFLSSFLFANEYYQAWQFVPFLVISSLFSSNSGFISAAFKAAKKTNSLFYTVLIGSLVNIVLNFVLIQAIGPLGASISTCIGFLVIWFFRIAMVQKIVKIKINIFRTFFSYLSLIISALVLCLGIDYCYLIILILCGAVILANIKEIINICDFSKTAFGKYFRRKEYNE